MRHKQTPSFILSLPLQVNPRHAAQLQAHFECARQLYNALLAEGMKRLKRMKADPAWQAARSIPRSDKPARTKALQPRSASWLRTGAACMANWPTRSSAWAMICGSKKSAIQAGSAALAEALDCVPLGAL